ncbi:hypothetical protein ACRRTK_023334 [Alexandromys fortis]
MLTFSSAVLTGLRTHGILFALICSESLLGIPLFRYLCRLSVPELAFPDNLQKPIALNLSISGPLLLVTKRKNISETLDQKLVPVMTPPGMHSRASSLVLLWLPHDLSYSCSQFLDPPEPSGAFSDQDVIRHTLSVKDQKADPSENGKHDIDEYKAKYQGYLTTIEKLQEAFVIDAVRTKMVYCKIDQTQRKVVVSHSTHRTFGKQQWQQLYDTLNAWKQNLNKVKNSLLSLSDT